MPAGLSALLTMISGDGQQLLDDFTYIFGWVFTTDGGGPAYKLTSVNFNCIYGSCIY